MANADSAIAATLPMVRASSVHCRLEKAQAPEAAEAVAVVEGAEELRTMEIVTEMIFHRGMGTTATWLPVPELPRDIQTSCTPVLRLVIMPSGWLPAALLWAMADGRNIKRRKERNITIIRTLM